MAVLLPMLVGHGGLLSGRWHRRAGVCSSNSPPSRGSTSTSSRAASSTRRWSKPPSRDFRHLLERGEADALEASLRPGMQYVVQVRALAEIGTDDAGQHPRTPAPAPAHRRPAGTVVVLDRPGQRPAQPEPRGKPAAPAALCRRGRRDSAGPFLRGRDGLLPVASPAICGSRKQPLGRRPCACCTAPWKGCASACSRHVVEARLGEMIETFGTIGPRRFTRCSCVVVETLRILRRGASNEAVADGGPDQEAFDWQMSRLAALEPVLTDYLDEAPASCSRCCPGPRPGTAQHPAGAQRSARRSRGTLCCWKSPAWAPMSWPDVLAWSRDPWSALAAGLGPAPGAPCRRAQWRRRPSPRAARPFPTTCLIGHLRALRAMRRWRPRPSCCWPRATGTPPIGPPP